MKKKAIYSLIVGLAIFGSVFAYNNISKNDSKNKNQQNQIKNNSNIINITSSFDSLYNYSDNKILAENSDYITLIRVESINGVSNKSQKTGEYISNPYTYGTARVLKSFKGEIPTQNIKFVRMGGDMPYNEWIKGDDDPRKMEEVRIENGFGNISTNDIIVSYRVENDIDIEDGKTYLAYLIQNQEYNLEDEYSIHAFQFGLREVENPSDDINNMMVKNNETGRWEALSNVIDIN